MKTVTLTEFRSHVSTILTDVENGETIVVLRHGRPIAEVVPASDGKRAAPSWKRPALRLSVKGSGLSSAILEERAHEGLS
jgi:prevent-host-death family protein